MPLASVFTFSLYLVAMLAIAYVAFRRTDNLADYVLGGRRLGPGATALSAGASDMSGWLLLGLPGAVYLGGLQAGWIGVGLVLGALLNWIYVSKELRTSTHCYDALTLPDYFEARFDDETRILRLVSAFVILLFFTFYTASGLVAGAKLFSASFGWSYEVALWTGAVVIVVYTAVGGFLAVSWTDVVQGLLMELPAISYDNDGAPEVVIPDETGILVHLGNVQGLADGMVSLAEDHHRRRRLGQAGRSRCLKMFDWHRMVEDIERLYQRVVAG